MFDPDAERKKALLEIARNPAVSEQERLDACNELLDLEDPEMMAELVRGSATESATAMKGLAESAGDPEVRRQAAEALRDLHEIRRQRG